jgi:hypothetical protein
MLPASCQERAALVPCFGLWSLLLKPDKINRNGIYSGGTSVVAFKQKTFSGSAHLQGQQKLHHPPDSAACKCY